MNELTTPPKHVNFRAKKLFGAKIVLGDEEVIIHQDEAAFPIPYGTTSKE